MTGRTDRRSRRAGTLMLLGVLGAASACSSPMAPPPYDIISPASDTVSVLPNGTVRFEIRADPGVSVEYLVDGDPAASSPVFVFDPVRPEHTVTAVIRSTSPSTTLLERDFVVLTEVPGNLPPEILSLVVDNNLEALRDTVHARALVRDPDGSVERIEIDFGDDTQAVVSVGKETQVDAAHVYQSAGAYWVTITVTDSVDITASDSTSIQVMPPNQLPVGSLTVSGETEGEAPLAVTLIPQGTDPDGTIVTWELDEEGDGTFHTIQPLQPVQFSYPFGDQPFRPALRLTDDDGDSSTFEAVTEILVFRSISASASDVEAQGNTALSLAGNPIIWADGRDPLVIMATVRDPQGGLVRDVPVRFTALRGDLIAADGSNLGALVPPFSGETGPDGRVTGFLTTETSTRVDDVPETTSRPFDVLVEASRGHNQWVTLSTVSNVEASSIVIGSGIGFRVVSAQTGGAFCPGELVEIRVLVTQRPSSPDEPGGPAPRRYTELRLAQFGNQVWLGARPAPSHSDWRTGFNGEVVFLYTPSQSENGRLFAAWVDGNISHTLGTFNFRPGC